MDKEWIIEQFATENDFYIASSYINDNANRYLSQYESRLERAQNELARLRQETPYQGSTRNRRKELLENETDGLRFCIKKIRAMSDAAAPVSEDTRPEWVPIYLFRPVGLGAWDYSWIEHRLYDLVLLPTYSTSLERCVSLCSEVQSILKTRTLRIRNIYTGEVIPCELFL